MKDQYTEDQKQLKSHEQLEAVAFHLTQLYHRLSQDFDRWAVTGGDLAEITETFDKQVAKFANLDQEVKHQLECSIKGGAEQISASFAGVLEQEIRNVLARNITSSGDSFLSTVQKVQHTLSGYERQIRYRRIWDTILCLVSSLIGSLLGGSILYFFLF